MKSLGSFLLVLGIGSFVLPLIGMQFRLINLVGSRIEVQIGCIVAGAALVILGSIIDSVKRPAGLRQAPPPRPQPGNYPGPQPIAPRATMEPPPAPAQQVSSAIGFPCPNCGRQQPASAKFCAVCGTPLPRVVAHPPVPPTPPPGPVLTPPMPPQVARSGCGCGAMLLVLLVVLAAAGGVGFYLYTTGNVMVSKWIAPAELTRGQNLVQSRQYRSAIAEFDKGLKRLPGHRALLAARANAFLWSNNLTAAREGYQSLVSSDPADHDSRRLFIQLLLVTGETQQGLSEAQRLANESFDLQSLIVLAQAQNWCGDSYNSHQTFQRVQDMKWNGGQALYDHANAYLAGGVYAMANLEFVTLLWLDSRHPGAWLGMGKARAAMGMNAAAAEAFERYLQFDRSSAAADLARRELSRLRTR